ncbi:MAG: arylesterase [Gammaproteobacteria bacterium]|nr:arylesterase [Gammaproteobacteria bacterium]
MQSSIFLLLLTISITSFVSTATLAGSSKILIMGDSLSAAYNISMEKSWPVIFQHKLKSVESQSEVINASISGETTLGGAERLTTLLDQHKPSHMILELGGNDGLRGFKFKQTKQALETMISMAQNQKVKVLMIGVRLPPNLGPVYNRRFQQIYQQLADQLDIVYLPRFLEGVAAANPEWMQQDGIHPTVLAQPFLANKVFSLFSSSYLQ